MKKAPGRVRSMTRHAATMVHMAARETPCLPRGEGGRLAPAAASSAQNAPATTPPPTRTIVVGVMLVSGGDVILVLASGVNMNSSGNVSISACKRVLILPRRDIPLNLFGTGGGRVGTRAVGIGGTILHSGIVVTWVKAVTALSITEFAVLGCWTFVEEASLIILMTLMIRAMIPGMPDNKETFFEIQVLVFGRG